MIDTLIFDADGVVIHQGGFVRYLAEEHAISLNNTRDFFANAFGDCLSGRKDLKQALRPYLTQWGWTEPVDDFISLWLEKDDNPNQVMIEKIQSLRRQGFHCCLASNQERHRAEYMRRDMRFEDLFDRLFFSHEIGAHKPDASFYSYITESLDKGGEQIFFWDDDVRNVDAAREAGWGASHFVGMSAFDIMLPRILGNTKKR